jgi:hypothetical protein
MATSRRDFADNTGIPDILCHAQDNANIVPAFARRILGRGIKNAPSPDEIAHVWQVCPVF